MIHVVLVLILIGVALYVIHALIPLDPKIRTILDVVVVLFVILWLLQLFGVLGLADVNVPKLPAKQIRP